MSWRVSRFCEYKFTLRCKTCFELFLVQHFTSTKVKLRRNKVRQLWTTKAMVSKIDIPSIVEQFKCPGCFEFMIPPFPQCADGHNVCAKCFYNVQSCAICEADLCLFSSNLLIKMYNLLTFPCPYEDCDEMVLGKIMQNHLKRCGCRIVSCNLCSWSGKVENVEDHVTTEHHEEETRL